MKKIYLILCFISVILAVVFRLYHFRSPIGDWHSWRQSDTAAVAQNFIKRGFDPFRPRYYDLSNIQSGKDNPEGYRMVEFPLYQSIAYGVTFLFPFLSIEEALRSVSIASSAISTASLFYIASVVSSPMTGFFTAITFALLPYNIYYGRAILPESFLVALYLLALASGLHSTGYKGLKKYLFFFLSSVFCALAFLVKPTAGFFLMPLLPVFIASFPLSLSSTMLGLLYIGISVTPLLFWRNWILHFPEGIPSYSWLFNGNGIRFTPAWFRWIFSERIAKLILGAWGLVFLCLGMTTSRSKREGWFIFFWVLGLLSYVVAIATGNVQHDYYQVPIIPVLSYFVGRGILVFWSFSHNKPFAGITVIAISFIFMVTIPWYEIKTYYWINRQDIMDAGRFADALLPKDAKVIAPNNGDTTFLYQIQRSGWPLGFDIAKKIQSGATHYVTVSPTDTDLETRDLANMFTVLVRNDRFAIIDLTKPRIAP